jgi:hypothetical protein
MSWNRGLRMMREPAVGALVAAGAVGAALLAGPMASSQASSGFTLSDSYYNGGFCYQNKAGEPNTYRLQVSERSYDSTSDGADLSFMVQRWDASSNQYRDEWLTFTDSVSKLSLGGYYSDANRFCTAMTQDSASQYLGGDVYNYGEWTSTRVDG